MSEPPIDAPALSHKARGRWKGWTWGEQRTAVARLAGGWRRLGLEPGDRVLILTANRPSALWCALAVRAAGGTALFVDRHVEPEQLTALLAVVYARFAFVGGEDELEILFEAAGAEAPERIVHEPGRIVAERDPRLVSLDGVPSTVAADMPEGAWETAKLTDRGEWLIASVGSWGAEAPALGAGDTALLLEPLAEPASLGPVVERWLAEGFQLLLPESSDSVGRDLADVAPTYLAASSVFFTALCRGALERAGAPGTWRRRLVETALASGRSLWARWLVLRPLARVLGLARVRAAVAVGAPLGAEARRFFGVLGIDVRGAADAPGRAPAPVLLAGSSFEGLGAASGGAL